MRIRPILAAGLVAATAAACARTPTNTAGRAAGETPTPAVSETPTPAETPAPRRLLYATKSGTKVTVRLADLDARTERTLFTYAERQPAEHSGNYWEGQSPAVAYSAAAGLIAYGAADGLHLYDIGTGVRTTLIERVTEGVDDAPPTWAPPMEGTYGISNVRWSGDGRYVSFDRPHYEGNTTAFYDRETSQLFLQAGMPFSYADPSLSTPAWAAGGASTITSVTGTKPGLFLSAANDPRRGSLVALRHERFGPAVLAPDGSTAAFLFNDTPDDYESLTGVGVIRRDGSGARTIDADGKKSSVLVDETGQVWWTEGGHVYRWDSKEKTIAARVDGSYVWQVLTADEKTITLAGRSVSKRRGLYLVIERGTGKALEMHGAGTEFVTFAGLI